VLIFDPDEGGRSAVERSLKLFVAEKMRARVAILPEGYDPDSFVLKNGKSAMDGLVSGAQSLVDYYIDHIVTKKDRLEENLDAVRNAVGFIVQIEDMVQRNLFIKRVAERLGIDQELLKAEIRKALSSKEQRAGKEVNVAQPKSFDKVDPIELSLILLFMERPDLIPVAEEEEKALDFLANEDLKAIGKILREKFRRDGNIAVRDVISSVENETIRDRLLKAVMEGSPYGAGIAEKVLADIMKKIKQRWFREKHKILKRELVKAQEMKDTNLGKQILIEKERLMKEEKALSSKIGEK
jgi:DNA primase